MRGMTIGMVAALTLLSACGGGEEPEVVASPSAPALTNAQDQVVALPSRLQEGVMLRAIRDAGLTCQSVTELTRVDDSGGNVRWRVICDKSEPYVVEIGQDGMARIRSRR